MKLSFYYYGQFKNAAGVEIEEREYPDAAGVETVAKELSDVYGEEFRSIILDDENNLRPSVIILVNNYKIKSHSYP